MVHMATCPLCGTANDPDQVTCVACGQALEPSSSGLSNSEGADSGRADAGTVPAAADRASASARTLLGLPNPFAEPSGPDAPMGAGGPKAPAILSPTLRSVAPAVATPADPGPSAAPGLGSAGKKTLLGFAAASPAPVELPTQGIPTQGTPTQGTGTPSAEAAQLPAPGAEPLGGKKTLLGGVSQPGFVPLPPPPPTPAPLPPPTPFVPPTVSNKQTLLGVARPGIAPTGRALQPAAAPPAPPPLDEELPGPPLMPRRRGRGVAIAGVVGALVLGGLALALWPRSSPHIEVLGLRVGAQGDEIVVRCADCSDGTRATLSASRSEFKNGEAIVKMDAPLTVGEHRLTLDITDPDGTNASSVDIVVPVAFRARAVLTHLGDEVPSASVEVNAPPGSQITVDGQALKPDAQGLALHPINLDKETSGEEGASKSFAKTVDVAVTPPGGAARHSAVELRAGVTPLAMNAPGPRVVLRGGDLIVSGRTAPNAIVRAGKARTKADASGRFVLTVRAPEPGPLRLAASGDGLATRTWSIALARTPDAAPAPGGFDQLKASLGKRVALQGQVVDARSQADGSSLLLEVKQGCSAAPCLVGALYPARLVAGMPTRGQELLLVGDVAQGSDGSPRLRVESFAVH